MKRLDIVEGQPLDVDAMTAQAIRIRLDVLRRELRPSIPFIAGADSGLAVQNLIGSVQVSPDLILDIQPKTEPTVDWAAAIIDLLTDDRVAIEAESQRAEKSARVILADALAARYADVLERALRREGPLLLLERRNRTRPVLGGRLDVTAWVQSRVLNPGLFPQSETVMTVDNTFATAMAWVAEALAIRCVSARLASRLRSVATRLRPGFPPHVGVDPGVALREIPTQWRGYMPAWTIARAVIRRIAPLHRTGVLDGLGLAIEPWPLLERLLHRGLEAAAQQAQLAGIPLTARPQSQHPLLSPAGAPTESPLRRLHSGRAVEPDGSLWIDDQIVATFEAKYSRAASNSTFRSHYFQALSTAAALDAPLAVLVYPELAEPVVWEVQGFEGKPTTLVAIGIDMYAYRRGTEPSVGTRLLNVVSDSSDTLATA